MGKLEITNLIGNTWVIKSQVNIGIYVENDNAVIIDSGIDKGVGKQILKLIEQKGWKLTGIINTHSNCDHVGGNAFLQENTDCRIYATRIEAAFIKDPILESSILWGGFPFKDLHNKFLEAEPSDVTDIIISEGRIGQTNLYAFPLNGHFFDMIGVVTRDNVIFLGDSIFSRHIIEKYNIIFTYDINEFINTLDKIGEMSAKIFVPSHGDPISDIGELVEINKQKVFEIADAILQICTNPRDIEDVLSEICVKYNINLTFNQYVLYGSTIKSYISYLYNIGKLECIFEKTRLFWKRK